MVTGPLGSSSWEMSAYRSAKNIQRFHNNRRRCSPVHPCRHLSASRQHFSESHPGGRFPPDFIFTFSYCFFCVCVIQIKRRARELISFSDQCKSKKTTQLYLLSREVAEDKKRLNQINHSQMRRSSLKLISLLSFCRDGSFLVLA